MTTLGIVVAVLLLFLAATRLSVAGRVAPRFREFQGRPFDVRAWGQALAGAGEKGMVLEQVRAIGAGLHLTLRSVDDDSVSVIKIAQPSAVTVDIAVGTIKVGEARYLQWRRRRLPRRGGNSALELRVLG